MSSSSEWVPIVDEGNNLYCSVDGQMVLCLNKRTQEQALLPKEIINSPDNNVEPEVSKQFATNKAQKEPASVVPKEIVPANNVLHQSANKENNTRCWTGEIDLFLISEVIKNWSKIKNISRKKTFEEIASRICFEFHNNITGTQADTKFKYLFDKYKAAVEANSKTGASPMKFKYFEIFNDFFHNKPEVVAPATASSLKGLKSSLISKKDIAEAGPSQESRKSEVLTKMEKKRNRTQENIERRHREKMARIDNLQHTLDALLKKFTKDESEDN